MKIEGGTGSTLSEAVVDALGKAGAK